jgi:hypothetical protein
MARAHNPKWYGGRGSLGQLDNGGLRRPKIRSDYGHDGPETPVGKVVPACRCGGTVAVPMGQGWSCRRCGCVREGV